MPTDWADELYRLADQDEEQAWSVAKTAVQELRAKVSDLDGRMSRLIDLYSDQDIDREAYLERKRALMSDKRSAEEQIARLEQDSVAWLQPLREFVKEASLLEETLRSSDLSSQKSSLQKIFGSNLSLTAREARGTALPQYAALRAAKINFSENSLSLFYCAR